MTLNALEHLKSNIKFLPCFVPNFSIGIGICVGDGLRACVVECGNFVRGDLTAFKRLVQDASQVSIGEVKRDGYCYLQLKVPSKRKVREGFWNFLERYGFRYGGSPGEELTKRTLLPCEVCFSFLYLSINFCSHF